MGAMDEIDQKQQSEIEALNRKDVSHDKELIYLRVLGVLIVLFAVMIFAMAMETIQKNGPYNCPHAECVHHRVEK